MKSIKTVITYIVIVLIIFVGTVSILNLDVLIRFYYSYQEGNLTTQKIRYDLASFDIGKKSNVMPVATKISEADGMVQVLVPEGQFRMGTGETYKNADSPQHQVFLDAFWIDGVEVSNAMYLKCIDAGSCAQLASDNTQYRNWIYRDHPVTYVTWQQAADYCQWAGRRLPTEAEWEKAGRGTDGRNYPWGNEHPNPYLANFNESMIHESVSVYRYPLGMSPYGALNMSGNVREWVSDWYDPRYYLNTPSTNPTGSDTGSERSLRSGSYNEDKIEIEITFRYKHEPESAGLSRGFRCAESASQ